MVLSSDLLLKNTLWNDSETTLCKTFLFDRLVELFIVACAIGIKEDGIIENNIDDDKYRSISRMTYIGSAKNDDLNTILTFLFQNAILNTKHVDFDMETRLKIAFDPDFPDEKSNINFSATNFLVKFATYGLQKIIDLMQTNILSSTQELYDYLDELAFVSKMEEVEL